MYALLLLPLISKQTTAQSPTLYAWEIFSGLTTPEYKHPFAARFTLGSQKV
jgi:hypothetical protein